ncbi:MAG TPA: pyridoxal phosphate-dependent aminotransferase [Syntrophomonadaceae bacterium]|nr:pyridoxal phosphate-dependent aminotransferase [Syntrophomonadaceae bacterium]
MEERIARTENISPFIVMEVLEKAQAMQARGEDVIHLEVGEPDFPTPEPVKEAAIRALKDNDTHYTHSLGKLALREEIARYYWQRFRVEISPEQVMVTMGTSPAMLLVFSVLLQKGDELILPNPYYACYPNFVHYLDAQPVYVPVNDEDGFQYRIEEIRARLGPATRAILVNSPANPTGMVCTAAQLQELAELPRPIVSDEIYSGLVYEGEEHTILEYSQDAFVINGFSKLFAMTGWRLGYIIVPRRYIRPLQILQQNLFICASSFCQEAGIAALRYCQTEVEDMRRIYDQRRLYVLQRLEEMNLATVSKPTGAFYALADLRHISNDSYKLAFDILQEAKVALTPGIDFGSNCEGYLRLSYANSLENIKEGLDRLQRYLALR